MTLDNSYEEPIQVDLQPIDPIAALSYSRSLTTRDICRKCTNIERGTTNQTVCSMAHKLPRNEWPAYEAKGEHGGHLVACYHYQEISE